MSPKPIEEMTDRELDAAVAQEVCGLNIQNSIIGLVWMAENGKGDFVPHYSTDLNACREAELELVKSGTDMEHGIIYGEVLRDLVSQEHGVSFTNFRLECALADARTRCRAMLKTVRSQ